MAGKYRSYVLQLRRTSPLQPALYLEHTDGFAVLEFSSVRERALEFSRYEGAERLLSAQPEAWRRMLELAPGGPPIADQEDGS